MNISDEASLIEQFLLALPHSLRDKVILNGHRAWQSGEFEQLVTCTTDRVNSQTMFAHPTGRVETNRQDQQLDKRKFAGDKMTHSQRSADKKQRRDGAAAGPSQTSPETEGFRTAARQNYHLKHNKCFKCGKTGEAGKRCTRAGLYTWSPPSDFSYGRHLWQGYDQELSIH